MFTISPTQRSNVGTESLFQTLRAFDLSHFFGRWQRTEIPNNVDIDAITSQKPLDTPEKVEFTALPEILHQVADYSLVITNW